MWIKQCSVWILVVIIVIVTESLAIRTTKRPTRSALKLKNSNVAFGYKPDGKHDLFNYDAYIVKPFKVDYTKIFPNLKNDPKQLNVIDVNKSIGAITNFKPFFMTAENDTEHHFSSSVKQSKSKTFSKGSNVSKLPRSEALTLSEDKHETRKSTIKKFKLPLGLDYFKALMSRPYSQLPEQIVVDQHNEEDHSSEQIKIENQDSKDDEETEESTEESGEEVDNESEEKEPKKSNYETNKSVEKERDIYVTHPKPRPFKLPTFKYYKGIKPKGKLHTKVEYYGSKNKPKTEALTLPKIADEPENTERNFTISYSKKTIHDGSPKVEKSETKSKVPKKTSHSQKLSELSSLDPQKAKILFESFIIHHKDQLPKPEPLISSHSNGKGKFTKRSSVVDLESEPSNIFATEYQPSGGEEFDDEGDTEDESNAEINEDKRRSKPRTKPRTRVVYPTKKPAVIPEDLKHFQ